MSAFRCVEENDQAELWAQLSAGPSAVRSENYIVSKRPITVQTLEGYQSGDISLGKKNKETLCPKKYWSISFKENEILCLLKKNDKIQSTVR